MRKILHTLTYALVSGLLLSSCSKDFTETQFFQEEKAAPLSTIEQLESFINGAYVKMRSTNYWGNTWRVFGELHTDEMYTNGKSGRSINEYSYSLMPNYGTVQDTWKKMYETVGNANIVINAAINTDAAKLIKGQAYALRGQAFFDLLRLYGQKYTGGNLGVVLPLEYNPNALQERATVAQTEDQIEQDLLKALELLGTTKNMGNRTVISSWAVKGLLTRFYLYKGDNEKAAQHAKDIEQSGRFQVAPAADLAVLFGKENAANSIFEIALGTNGSLGTTSYEFLLNSGGYANLVVLPSVVEQYEANDVRRELITKTKDGNFLDGKFPSTKGDTNIKVLRYEEVLLNGAEAMLETDATTALKYYNLIRTNRGLGEAKSVSLADIKNERKLELLGEGFRYWDLLRWGDEIPYYDQMGEYEPAKVKQIGDPYLALPIPEDETNRANKPLIENPYGK